MNIQEKRDAIAAYIKDRHICAGIGSTEDACSIAHINLAIHGELTDIIPACVSNVIGRWVICIQDTMPDDMRNSPEWRSALPLIAGTGRDREQQYAQIILKWMWDSVLPQLQPIADTGGFGAAWAIMLQEKNADAARAATHAAEAADAARAVDAARAATHAAEAADAARAVDAAHAAARAAARAAYWASINPPKLLQTLVCAS